jgi:hypothetical protein
LALSRLAKELMLNMKGTANSATMSPILSQSSGVQSEFSTGQPPHCCNNSTTGSRPRLSCESASHNTRRATKLILAFSFLIQFLPPSVTGIGLILSGKQQLLVKDRTKCIRNYRQLCIYKER